MTERPTFTMWSSYRHRPKTSKNVFQRFWDGAYMSSGTKSGSGFGRKSSYPCFFFRSRFLEEYLEQNNFLENLAQDTSAPHGPVFFWPSEQPCSSYVASTKRNCSIQPFFVEVDFSKITGNRIISLQTQLKTHQLHLKLIFFGHRSNPVRVMQHCQKRNCSN